MGGYSIPSNSLICLKGHSIWGARSLDNHKMLQQDSFTFSLSSWEALLFLLMLDLLWSMSLWVFLPYSFAVAFPRRSRILPAWWSWSRPNQTGTFWLQEMWNTTMAGSKDSGAATWALNLVQTKSSKGLVYHVWIYTIYIEVQKHLRRFASIQVRSESPRYAAEIRVENEGNKRWNGSWLRWRGLRKARCRLEICTA